MAAGSIASTGAPARRESATHWAAHQGVLFIRPVFLIFLGATVVLMATFWPLAVVTGLIALACGVAVLVCRGVEERTEAGDEATRNEQAIEAAVGVQGQADRSIEEAELETTHVPGGEIDARTLVHESWMVGGIAAGLVLLATIVGLALFDWHMLLVGIGAVLLYGAFITFPAWSAWLADDAEQHARNLERMDR